MKRLLLLLPLLLMTACDSVDHGACLKTEETITLIPIPIMNGNTTTFMWLPAPVTTCVQWEYPNGKPQSEHRS